MNDVSVADEFVSMSNQNLLCIFYITAAQRLALVNVCLYINLYVL